MNHVICGLGNPGARFQRTRHNAGFIVIREMARRHHISLEMTAFESKVGRGKIGGKDVVLVLPQTFMNRSGEGAAAVLRSLGSSAGCFAAVYDDMDIAQGKIRIRREGGSGGHLGCESLIGSLKTDRFPRVRVGIGRPPESVDPTDYVLEPLDETEYRVLVATCKLAADALEVLVGKGLDAAMAEYNAALAGS